MSDSFRVPELGRRPIVSDPSEMLSPKPASRVGESSFKDILTGAVSEVQRLQTEADVTIKKVVAGEIRDVTSAMVAVEKADVAFQTMMAVRNKMVAAYEEVMRMQV